MHTILICDDDRDIVSALDIYLTSEGYRTLKAYNGLEAIQAVERNEVHLILMDIMMPELWTGSGPLPGCGRGAISPSSFLRPRARMRIRSWD